MGGCGLLVGVGRVEGDLVEPHLERRHVVVGDVHAFGLGHLGVEVGEDQLVGELLA